MYNIIIVNLYRTTNINYERRILYGASPLRYCRSGTEYCRQKRMHSKKKRPYVIVSNESGIINSTIITLMPLTHVIKKTYLPVHECIAAESDNGLNKFSMILGEQPQTVSKNEIIRKFGNVTNKEHRRLINKVCFNTFFYGEDIDWREVLA